MDRLHILSNTPHIYCHVSEFISGSLLHYLQCLMK